MLAHNRMAVLISLAAILLWLNLRELVGHRYIRGLGLFEHNAVASIWSKQ